MGFFLCKSEMNISEFIISNWCLNNTFQFNQQFLLKQGLLECRCTLSPSCGLGLDANEAKVLNEGRRAVLASVIETQDNK